MEALTAIHDGDDANIGAAILMRFTDSNRELDLEIRKLIVVMSGIFRNQNAPPTPVGYLCATCSSLDIAAASDPQAPAHVLDAHFTIMSIVIPKVPAAFLINNLRQVFDSLARPLWSSSPSTDCLEVRCIAQLFIAAAKVVNNWSDVSELFSSFLSLAFLDGLKVRSQLCLCLPDVLRSFQGTPLFAPATKQITDLLNKYPPLVDCDENASASVRSQQAKALGSLHVVKVPLSLLSADDRTAVLVYFKTLLELNQFFVTAPIIDDNLMCIPVTTAGFLSIGLTRVYSFNRKVCEINLPIVFDALKVILEDPNSSYIPDPVHAFRCLIHACIDESLIKEGVDRVVMNASMGDGIKSEPTIIENLCATIESLLYSKPNIQCPRDYRMFTFFTWAPAFDVVSTMFEKLGPYSSFLMRGTLKTLADMQKLPDREFHFKEVKIKRLLEKLVQKYGLDAIMAFMPQELKNLLVETNEKASKPVEVISHVLGATAVRSESSNNRMHVKALGPCKNSKWKRDIQGNGLRDRLARSRAKREMTNRMLGAAVMAKELKI
uniref:uncharacterized protein LOC101313649 isoform X2 n=1 Tax=Fragaria vesca subsp. vesca TaxID=101020 RepID=UPI0005C9D8B0|nr:PREDICTED: uncharacterized protein LOC101313649 isoform X2 [Fragaria vesca subsp. vesca]